MLKDLHALFVDITESKTVSVSQNETDIEIKIVSRWFDNMDQTERLDYLTEAIEAIYPDLYRKFKFRFIAHAPREMN